MKSLNVSWILFDFGGCLDSDGEHSRTLYLNQFIQNNLIDPNDDHSFFQDAYSISDRKIIDEKLVLNSTLLKTNQILCSLIAHKLNITQDISKVAQDITTIQAQFLNRNKFLLRDLSLQHKLGIISNFSGNLRTILDEFSLSPFFQFVLDSYHVGFEKPSPEIFHLAIKKCNTLPSEICFVGDNPERDIAPANSLGMKTVLIGSAPHKIYADFTLSTLTELLPLTQMA